MPLHYSSGKARPKILKKTTRLDVLIRRYLYKKLALVEEQNVIITNCVRFLLVLVASFALGSCECSFFLLSGYQQC